jgi:hypothetical protein
VDSGSFPWRVAGRYFESCNCKAVCPCRMVDGVQGGRSTYGICEGVLGWRIDDGQAGDADLGGLAVAMTIRYDDDEPGSPWTIVLHVDEQADERRRGLLADLFLGRLGGPAIVRLPWVAKPSEVVAVRPSRIELGDGPVHELRVGSAVRLRASRPVEGQGAVSCGIPGYERVGGELYADELVVDDDPFAWELSGNCAFATSFEYASG